LLCQQYIKEKCTDGNGNNLDANLYQENYTNGAGASFNVGFIYKARANFRFGMAYQSPTWFTEIIETTNITDNEGYFGDTMRIRFTTILLEAFFQVKKYFTA